jgi:23S rRNA G2445 N2-methylase RlmL
MARHAKDPNAPLPCYALTVPGLEALAAQELEEAGAAVRRSLPGLIVFRPKELDRAILRLRTVEDVFLLLWGTDKLTFRAQDLDQISRWTAKEPDWPQVLQVHHALRPKPKGRPNYRLVTQMRGKHGYRRVDALKALAKGLAGKFPASWQPAEENAAIEVWLTITGQTAVCGLRLSDKTMRHRTYKEAHVPASLRPVVAAAMIRLASAHYGQVLCDPMCGAGTILGEQLAVNHSPLVLGGDLDHAALYATAMNLRHLGEPVLARWDARHLPMRDETLDRIVCNPPFGKQLGTPEEMSTLYEELLTEWDRVLKPGAKAVLLVSDAKALDSAAKAVGWRREERLRLRLLGQPSYLYVWGKRP